jgi:hypothetical protein
MLGDDNKRVETLAERSRLSRERLKADPRLDLPDRPAVLDTPSAHAFSIGDEEFIAGTPATVGEQIIQQCCQAGAGNFAALFDRSARPEKLREWYGEFGAATIPLLHSATV